METGSYTHRRFLGRLGIGALKGAKSRVCSATRFEENSTCLWKIPKTAVIAFVVVALAGVPAVARASSHGHDLELRERAALSALQTIARSASCGAKCQAAYDVVASALSGDRSEVLTQAILATANFDYVLLTRALRIPTIPQIKAQWRERCKHIFPGSKQLQRLCFQLILGPPDARPVGAEKAGST